MVKHRTSGLLSNFLTSEPIYIKQITNNKYHRIGPCPNRLLLEGSRFMQIGFFGRHPAAFFAFKFWISDNIAKLAKVFGDVFFLPLTHLFCHFKFSSIWFRHLEKSVNIFGSDSITTTVFNLITIPTLVNATSQFLMAKNGISYSNFW